MHLNSPGEKPPGKSFMHQIHFAVRRCLLARTGQLSPRLFFVTWWSTRASLRGAIGMNASHEPGNGMISHSLEAIACENHLTWARVAHGCSGCDAPFSSAHLRPTRLIPASPPRPIPALVGTGFKLCLPRANLIFNTSEGKNFVSPERVLLAIVFLLVFAQACSSSGQRLPAPHSPVLDRMYADGPPPSREPCSFDGNGEL